MKNPFRHHTHAESDNTTLAVFFVLTLALCALTFWGIAKDHPNVVLFGALSSLVAGCGFKLELAMFD